MTDRTRARAHQNPLAVLFELAFLTSGVLWMPRIASQFGWMGAVSSYWRFAGRLGSSLPALIYSREGLGRLLRGMFKWRLGALWWLAAGLVAVLLALFHAVLDIAMVNQALSLPMVNLMWGLAVVAPLQGRRVAWEVPEREHV